MANEGTDSSMETLSMATLVGTDVPELTDSLDTELHGQVKQGDATKDALLVMTHAQAEKQRKEAEYHEHRQVESGVCTKPLAEIDQEVELSESEKGFFFLDELFNTV